MLIKKHFSKEKETAIIPLHQMMFSLMKRSTLEKQTGFTLIEILLVIGIIAVLATVVIVALDPATRFRDARNSRRTSDIQSIATAISQYVIDNKGAFPPGINTTEKQIATSSDTCAIDTGGCAVTGETDCVDISSSLNRYLKEIPFDPATGAGLGPDHSHYSVVLDANNIITVRACDAEGDPIYLSR